MIWVALAWAAVQPASAQQASLAAAGEAIGKPGFSSSLISTPKEVLHHLADHGITFQVMLVNDWSKALKDDADATGGFGRYSLDVSATADTAKLLGLSGSQAFVRVKNHFVEFGNTYDRAAQGYSNIDASSRTTLYELWFEQRLLSNKLRFKGGKMDANGEFAVVTAAGDFLNSSMGYSPTIMFFPTYPEPQAGGAVFVEVASDYRLSAAVFKAGSNGPLMIFEPGRKWTLGETEHPGRVSVGYWRLQGDVDRFDGDVDRSAQGYYSVLEQSLWRPRDPLVAGKRELLGFVQFGYADGEISPFTRHLGGGAVLSAPFRRRDRDAMGVATTWVRFSHHPLAGFTEPAESVVEAYYKISIARWIGVVPDLQILHHPGGLGSNPDCAVLTQRLAFVF